MPVLITILLRGLSQFLVLASASLLALVAGSMLNDIYQANVAYYDFKRKSNGLMTARNRSIICNHALLGIEWNVMKNNLEDYKKYGIITMAALHQNQFAAITFDPKLMKRIILDEPNKNINRLEINGPAAELMEDSIVIARDDQWRRLRRAVAPALRSNKFKAPNVVREIESSIERLVEAIENKLSASHPDPKLQKTTVEADDMLHRFTLDVVFRCFYKQYDLIDFNAPHCRWIELVDEGLVGGISLPCKIALMFPSLRLPIDWLIMNFHRQGKWRRELMDFVRRQTRLSFQAREELSELKAKGLEADEDNFEMKDGNVFRRNMADHITDHLLDGKITQREYFNTTGFLLSAGDKTALDALVYTVYLLGVDVQGVQEKLRDSIKREGSDSVYLDWVISESLRLLSPVLGSCGRVVSEDMEIGDGKRIPAGTFMAYPSFVIHRLKEYWGEDAEEFKPERWQDTSNHHPMQYVPFGAGVRICPGREFALFEMKESLSTLLLRYKFKCEVKPDVHDFYSPFGVYILFNSPTFVQITRI